MTAVSRPDDDSPDGSGSEPTLRARTAPHAPGQARSAAFQTLFETHLQYVWNTLRYLGVRSADTRDVAQEVFLTVFERFDDYDPSRSVRTWLFVISYHAASNYRRLARHRRELPEAGEEAAGPGLNAEQLVASREETDLLVHMISQIELPKRAVLVMHDMDGIAMPEIADSLSIPLNTAYSRLRLARKELQDHAQRLGVTGARS